MSDVLPPPPPPRGGDSFWKWGAITCGGLGCLAIVGLIVFAVVLLNSPQAKQVFAAFEKAQKTAQHMRTIGKAIDLYVRDKHKYPARLKDLIPNYLPDESSLRSSADPNGPPFLYSLPPKEAPPDTVLLQYDLPSPAPGLPTGTLKLRIDGRIEGLDEYQNVSRLRSNGRD